MLSFRLLASGNWRISNQNWNYRLASSRKLWTALIAFIIITSVTHAQTTSVMGPTGNAATFDGIDDHIRVSTSQSAYFSLINTAASASEFTLEAWINPCQVIYPATGGVKSFQAVIEKWSGSLSYQLRVDQGYLLFVSNTAASTGSFNWNLHLTDDPVIEPNRWTHVALVHSVQNNTVSFYVDGTFVNSGAFSTGWTGSGVTPNTITNNPTLFNGSTIGSTLVSPGSGADKEIRIGVNRTTNLNTVDPYLLEFEGQMDDVRYYASPRSQAQILTDIFDPTNATAAADALIFYNMENLDGTGAIENASTNPTPFGTSIAGDYMPGLRIDNLSIASSGQGYVGTAEAVPSCPGGNTGAADLTLSGSPSVTYQWIDIGVSPHVILAPTTASVSGLAPGTYKCVAVESPLPPQPGCALSTTAYYQIASSPITLGQAVTQPTCTSDGLVTITPSGGSNNYAYSWSPASAGTATSGTSNALTPGSYSVTVTDNINGCTESTSVTLLQPTGCGNPAGLPVWPHVTGAPGGGNTPTDHELVNWTASTIAANAVNSGVAQSVNAGPAQAGINGCNELVFFTLHNGVENLNSTPSPQLQLYTATGQQMPIAGGTGEMLGNRGDDEVQVVRRPGTSNQWFVIYSIAPDFAAGTVPAGAPNQGSYVPSNLAYSLIEVNGTSASYVQDGLGAIENRLLDVGGTQHTYLHGKAVSVLQVGSNTHMLYAQRRNISNGTISSQVIVDAFQIGPGPTITYSNSSGAGNGYAWSLMAAGSPLEISPAGDQLAVMARTDVSGDNQRLYLFNLPLTGAAPTEINFNSMWIDFGTGNVAPGGGQFQQSMWFQNNPGTNFEWLKNFDRKLQSIEFSPNGGYLYITNGGYVNDKTQNYSYLGQINLDPTTFIAPNQPIVRLQVQTAVGPVDPTSGLGGNWGNTSASITAWNPIVAGNQYTWHNIRNIQSSYDGNFYFTKGNSQQLWVLPNPDAPLPINLNPHEIDFGTALVPNIPMSDNGNVTLMPDQIDWFDYSLSNYISVSFDVSNESNCGCDPFSLEIIDRSTSNTVATYAITTCPETVTVCVPNDGDYDLSGNGIIYDNAVVDGVVNYPTGTAVFSFATGSSTTVTQNIATDTYWQGTIYIPDNTVIQVDGAELDITNVDVLFGSCAGIDFINGGYLRANNSVFRPCAVDGTWRGLRFVGSGAFDNMINECTFKNAETALYMRTQASGIVSENLFSNCNHGVYVSSHSNFDHPISGNRFVLDKFYPAYESCYSFVDGSVAYGIRLAGASMESEIAHNEFLYSNNELKQEFYGIDSRNSGAAISENLFTNVRNPIALISPDFTTHVDGNEIEYNQAFTEASASSTVAAGIYVSGSKGALVRLSHNEVVLHHLKAVEYGIFARTSTALTAINNSVRGFERGIHFNECYGIEIAQNQIAGADVAGIYFRDDLSQGGSDNWITCNDVSIEDWAGTGIDVRDSGPNTQVTSNCVKDSRIALRASDAGSGQAVPYIRNNYLYNYAVYGIYITDHVGDIGTTSDPGMNTLWSNSTATDIASVGGTIAVADNFGQFSISWPTVQIASNNPKHSTASCGHQIFNMPSQGNLNIDWVCQQDPDSSDAPLLRIQNQTMLAEDYLSRILQAPNPVDAAGMVLTSYPEADAVLLTTILHGNSWSEFEKALLKTWYLRAKGQLENALDCIQASQPVTTQDSDMKQLLLLGLHQLQFGLSLSEEGTVWLNAIAESDHRLANEAIALLRNSSKHMAYKFDPVEDLPIQLNLETKRVNQLGVDLQLSPNPTTDILYIDMINPEVDPNSTLSIYDALGKQLHSLTTTIAGQRTEVNVQALPAGAYLVVVTTETDRQSARFIKQ